MPDKHGNFKLSISVPELPWERKPDYNDVAIHRKANEDLQRMAKEQQPRWQGTE